MSQTFKNMQDDVKDDCQELLKQTDLTPTRLKKMINRGYKQFVRETKALTQPLTFTTVANQAYYSSSDTANWAYAYEVIDVKYITESTEFGKELFPYPGGYSKVPTNKAYGEPTYYYTYRLSSPELVIGTYPIIDVSSETLSVRVYNYPLAELSDDANEPLLPDGYRDALVFYAVHRLFQAYSHLNPVYRKKSSDYKSLYQELVDGFKFDTSTIDTIQQVYNVDVEY